MSKNLTLRVSAKDQQGNSQTQPAISFGGPGGRRMAQVVTVGASGHAHGHRLAEHYVPVGNTAVGLDPAVDGCGLA